MLKLESNNGHRSRSLIFCVENCMTSCDYNIFWPHIGIIYVVIDSIKLCPMSTSILLARNFIYLHCMAQKIQSSAVQQSVVPQLVYTKFHQPNGYWLQWNRRHYHSRNPSIWWVHCESPEKLSLFQTAASIHSYAEHQILQKTRKSKLLFVHWPNSTDSRNTPNIQIIFLWFFRSSFTHDFCFWLTAVRVIDSI